MTLQKALVVDDSRLARVALSKLLTRRNLDVDVAGSGQEALEYLRQQAPDVVFIDYMMPVMDGVQATYAIREFERLNDLPQTPIIALTANAMHNEVRRGKQAGFDDYLTKPISVDELLATLKTHLR